MSQALLALTAEELRAIVREEVSAVSAPDKPEVIGDVLTRSQTAKLLGVNPHRIPKLIANGLPWHPIGDNQKRFLRAEVLAWVAGRKGET